MSRPPFQSLFGKNALPTHSCSRCTDRFFTRVGLDEHIRLGQHNTQGYTGRWATGCYSPEGLAVQQAKGRKLAAQNNARRVRCDGCGHESTPAGVGIHQHYTGHTGRTELSREQAA